MKKILLVLLIFALKNISAQNNVCLGISNNNTKINTGYFWNTGYNLSLGYLYKRLNFTLNYSFISIKNIDYDKLEFKKETNNLTTLSLGYKLFDLNRLHLFAGCSFGLNQYVLSVDNYSSSGNYYLWNNGLIYNAPENYENHFQAELNSPDLDFETVMLQENSFNFIPYLEVNYILGNKFTFNVFYNYNLNVNYSNYGVGIKYFPFNKTELKKNNLKHNVDYREIDKTDLDDDKIIDTKDIEPLTPAGASVNEYGQSLDSDNDFIPDYRDKENNTPDSLFTDQYGIGQTYKLLYIKELIKNGDIFPIFEFYMEYKDYLPEKFKEELERQIYFEIKSKKFSTDEEEILKEKLKVKVIDDKGNIKVFNSTPQ